jgi:hypothetical protein
MRAVGIAVFAVLGVGLVLSPLISDHVRQATAARLLESRRDLKEVNLGPAMGLEYRLLCWVTGGIMILIGAMFGAEAIGQNQRSGMALAVFFAVAIVIALCLAGGYILWSS